MTNRLVGKEDVVYTRTHTHTHTHTHTGILHSHLKEWNLLFEMDLKNILLSEKREREILAFHLLYVEPKK